MLTVLSSFCHLPLPPVVGKKDGEALRVPGYARNRCQSAIEPPYGGGRVDMQSN